MTYVKKFALREASFWISAWLAGLLALAAMPGQSILFEGDARAAQNARIYYSHARTITTYPDAAGEVTTWQRGLRPVVE